ncbi:MAG: prepilin peptidase [Elusimicrobiota bacterium]
MKNLPSLFCMQNFYEYLITFAVGSCMGSFANVLIYRIPLNVSIIKPRSKCPVCNEPIKWYDNIPILSYLILGAKCRNCRKKIPISYLLVELAMGLNLTLLWHLSPDLKTFLVFSFFSFTVTVIAIIDLKHSIIPDVLSFTTLFSGVLLSPLNIYLNSPFKINLLNSITGALSGAFIMYVIALIGRQLFNKEAMGGGDIKFMSAAGAFLGWKNLMFVLFIGSLSGTIISLFLIYVLKKKKWGDYIPYGPFLSCGVLINIYLLLIW